MYLVLKWLVFVVCSGRSSAFGASIVFFYFLCHFLLHGIAMRRLFTLHTLDFMSWGREIIVPLSTLKVSLTVERFCIRTDL